MFQPTSVHIYVQHLLSFTTGNNISTEFKGAKTAVCPPDVSDGVSADVSDSVSEIVLLMSLTISLKLIYDSGCLNRSFACLLPL